MGIGRLVSGVLVTAALVAAAGATPAQAAVSAPVTSVLGCLNDNRLTATVTFTVQARSAEELEGPNIKVTKIEATNPCSHTISGVLGVRDTRTGVTFDAAFNVRPGSSPSLGPRKLEAYGLNKRYRPTNSFGSSSGPTTPGPGVVVVGTSERSSQRHQLTAEQSASRAQPCTRRSSAARRSASKDDTARPSLSSAAAQAVISRTARTAVVCCRGL